MMKRMQEKYADKPVKFVLVPCNQFGAQEPKSNSDIKAFAEQSVSLGAKSNVVMLAKSNLNGVKCTYTGADACMPSSAECCPKNDAVYDYLLANTKPGTVGWNFDKIITGTDGKPYKGEKILTGPDVEPQLSAIIDTQLAAAKDSTKEMLSSMPPATNLVCLSWVAAAALASFVAALTLLRWRQSRERNGVKDNSDGYVYLVA